MTCQDSYDRAKNLLSARRKELDALAQGLMKYETLDSEEISCLLTGRPVKKKIAQ